MIWKSFYFKGNNISKQTSEYVVWLTNVERRNVETSSSSRNVIWYHWIKLSPSFARWRQIAIEGIIDGDTRESLSLWMDYLDELFALEAVPDVLKTYEFSVEDEQEKRRTIQAKIKDKIEYTIDEDLDIYDGYYRRFRVVLEAENSRFASSIQKSVSGVEGVFWWTTFPVQLWVAFDDTFNEIIAQSNGNIPAPCVITVTLSWNLDSILYFKNSDWTFFGLDITGVAGDILILDSVNKTATKNWINILATRVAWSNRQNVWQDTTFFIYDADQALHENDFSILITFNDILL